LLHLIYTMVNYKRHWMIGALFSKDFTYIIPIVEICR